MNMEMGLFPRPTEKNGVAKMSRSALDGRDRVISSVG